jgi:phosphatidylserine decarboxylase
MFVAVMLLSAQSLDGAPDPVPIVFIAIGALLVGSIGWTKAQGDSVAKGEEVMFLLAAS